MTHRPANNSTDRIEKDVTLQAPRSRVWRALTDAREFSQWFGIALDGPFVVGKPVHGVFPTDDVPDDMRQAIAAEEERLGLSHGPIKMPPRDAVFCVVERMDPEHTFAFRWVPYGIDGSIVDLDKEPMTLVEFRLDAPDAKTTHLHIVESGFDRVPAHRRQRAFKMNEGGWAAQSQNLAKHVESH
jgi:uncharacterized protein YndB with AHSA1/START domain